MMNCLSVQQMFPSIQKKQALDGIKCQEPVIMLDLSSEGYASVSVARLEGFEPPACGLEVRCSIQLSYRRPSCVNVDVIPYDWIFFIWQWEVRGVVLPRAGSV